MSYCSCAEDGKWECALGSPPYCDVVPDGLPVNQPCDPNNELPTRPDNNCPIEEPNSNDRCNNNDSEWCEYSYIYTGCNWDELQCSPMSYCSCTEEGKWECALGSPPFCDVVPNGLPVYQSCDPNNELPK